MDIEELHKIECFALPGSGSCGKSALLIELQLVQFPTSYIQL